MQASALYPLVRPFAVAAPFPLIDQHITLAARNFCTRTRCWAEQLDALLADGYSTEYALPLDDQAQGFKLTDCTIAGEPAVLLDSPAGLRKATREGFSGIGAGLSPDGRRLLLAAAPAEGAEIRVELALQPVIDAHTLPDMLEEHAAVIADGALGSLLRLPQPWRDTAEADVRIAMFRDECNRVSIRSSRGRTGGALRVTPNHY